MNDQQRHTTIRVTQWIPVVIAILVITAVVGWFVADRTANGDYYSMKAVLQGEKYSAADLEQALVGHDGVVTGGEVKAIREVLSDDIKMDQKLSLTLAAIACVDKGFPEDLAREMADSMFVMTREMWFNNKIKWSETEALTLLNFIGAENFTADMFDQLYRVNVLADGNGVCQWITALPTSKQMAVYSELVDGSKQQATFEKLMRSPQNDEELEACLAEMDENMRIRYLQRHGASISDPDQVLAFIRFGRRMGYKASQLYPQGAAITLATEHCSSGTVRGTAPDGPFLVMHRTEEKPPYVQQDTFPMNIFTGGDTSDHQAFAVVLDVHTLDQMPEELIPQTMAECKSWVFLDTRYQIDGYLAIDRVYRIDPDGTRHTIPSYAISYAAINQVAAYDAATGECCCIFASQENNSPPLPSSDVEGRDYYLGQTDKAWLTRQAEQFRQMLQQYGYDLGMVHTNSGASHQE